MASSCSVGASEHIGIAGRTGIAADVIKASLASVPLIARDFFDTADNADMVAGASSIDNSSWSVVSCLVITTHTTLLHQELASRP